MLRAVLMAGLKRPRQPRTIQIRSATGKTEALDEIFDEYVNNGVKLDPVDSQDSAYSQWQTITKTILDQSIYPIGFTTPTTLRDQYGRGEFYEPSVWKIKLSEALDGVKPNTHRTGFKLLDRLQFETINSHVTDSSPLLEPDRLRWVLKCWKASLSDSRQRNQLSPEDVWSKVRNYYASRIVLHEDLALAIIIDAFDSYYGREDAAPRAMLMIDNDDSPVPLEATSIGSLLQLWRRSKLPELATETSDALLSRTTPTPSMLATVVSTWTAHGDADVAADRAERYLQQEVDDPTLLAASVHALVKADRLERAHQVLYQWIQAEQSYLVEDSNALKTIRERAKRFPVASMMQGYKKRMEKQPIVALEQLEAFEKEMEQLADKGDEWSVLVRPNLDCHQIMLSAYAQVGKTRMAEEKMQKLMLEYGSPEKWSKTKKHAFVNLWNSVMDAWIQSGDASAFSQCTTIVQDLEENHSLLPNSQSYNTLLKSLHGTEMMIHQKAKEINSIFKRAGRKADESTYINAMQLLGEAGHPEGAKSLLRNMRTAGLKPRNAHFITVMKAFLPLAKGSDGELALRRISELVYALERSNEKYGFKPKVSILAITIFLHALVHSKKQDPGKRAYEKFMIAKAWKVNMNPTFCTAVLAVFLRSKKPDTVERATEVFSEMKKLHTSEAPTIDANTWTTLVAIYAKRSMYLEAEQLFNEMQSAEDPTLHPTFHAYTTMLTAYGNGGQPKSATSMLEELLTRYEDGRFGQNDRPTTSHFNSILKAWFNSSTPEAASEIEDRIAKMNDLATKFDCRPDLASYALGFRASFSDLERVLRLYSQLTDQYNSSGSPRPHLSTYRDMVAVMTKMIPVPVTDLHTVLADMERYTSMAAWKNKAGAKLATEILFHLSNADIEERDHERLKHEVHVMLHKYRKDSPIDGVDLSDVMDENTAPEDLSDDIDENTVPEDTLP